MPAQHAFLDGAQPLDRPLRPFVATIGLELNPERAEILERVPKQEVFRLGVRGRPVGARGEPRPSDFEPPIRPPDLDEPGGPDGPVRLVVDDRERDLRAERRGHALSIRDVMISSVSGRGTGMKRQTSSD